MDITAGRTDRAQRGEFVEMVLCAGIQCLRDDHSADNHAQQGARKQRQARAGVEQPEMAAAVAELLRRQHLGIGHPPRADGWRVLRRRRPVKA